MKKWLKLIFMNYMVLLTIIVTFEIVGQIGYRIVRGKYVYQRFSIQEDYFKPDIYTAVKSVANISTGDEIPIKITTDQNGQRITKPIGTKIDSTSTEVWCFGGSTTYCAGVSDADSWPYLLQEKLGPSHNVINYGVPGYSSFESMVQFLEQLTYGKPDVVIFYLGWNDIRFYHDTSYHNDISSHGYFIRKALLKQGINFRDHFFTPLFISKAKSITNNIIFNPTHILKINDPKIDSIYKDRIINLVAIAKQINIKIIIVSQVINEQEYLLQTEKAYYWTPYIDDNAFPELMRSFNGLLGQAISEDSTCLLIDSLMINHQWVDDDFVDEAHFSKDGNKKLADIIAPSLIEISEKAD